MKHYLVLNPCQLLYCSLFSEENWYPLLYLTQFITIEGAHLVHTAHMSHEKDPLTFHYTGCLIGGSLQFGFNLVYEIIPIL